MFLGSSSGAQASLRLVSRRWCGVVEEANENVLQGSCAPLCRGFVWVYTRPALAGHPIPLCALRRAALTLGTSDPHGLRWRQHPSFDPTRRDAAPPYAPSGAGEAPRYRSPGPGLVGVSAPSGSIPLP
eukprot:tig00020614_g12227.t1